MKGKRETGSWGPETQTQRFPSKVVRDRGCRSLVPALRGQGAEELPLRPRLAGRWAGFLERARLSERVSPSELGVREPASPHVRTLLPGPGCARAPGDRRAAPFGVPP